MAAQRFRLVGTTADVALLAWGSTAGELFENAATGLTRAIARPRGLRAHEARRVSVEGANLEELLVAWLSEWLYLFDAEGFIGRDFKVLACDGGKAVGVGRGDVYSPERHELRMEVKGVTYHDLAIREHTRGLQARVLLDI